MCNLCAFLHPSFRKLYHFNLQTFHPVNALVENGKLKNKSFISGSIHQGNIGAMLFKLFYFNDFSFVYSLTFNTASVAAFVKWIPLRINVNCKERWGREKRQKSEGLILKGTFIHRRKLKFSHGKKVRKTGENIKGIFRRAA